jgi:hypothetical protein
VAPHRLKAGVVAYSLFVFVNREKLWAFSSGGGRDFLQHSPPRRPSPPKRQRNLGFFKTLAPGGRHRWTRQPKQPGASTAVQSASVDRFGIGHSGTRLRCIRSGGNSPLQREDGEFFKPGQVGGFSPCGCVPGDDRLARFLGVYRNSDPPRAMDRLI